MTPLELGLNWIREEDGSYVVCTRSSLDDVEDEILSAVHFAEDHGKISRNTRKLLEVSLEDGRETGLCLQTTTYDKVTGRIYEIIKSIKRDNRRISTSNLHRNHTTVGRFFLGYREGENLRIRILKEYIVKDISLSLSSQG